MVLYSSLTCTVLLTLDVLVIYSSLIQLSMMLHSGGWVVRWCEYVPIIAWLKYRVQGDVRQWWVVPPLYVPR